MHQILNKIIRIANRITLLIFVTLIALLFLPIKMCIMSTDDINKNGYYVVYLVPKGTTGAGKWICYDQDNVQYSDINFEGKLPQNILSSDVYAGGTTFIIYGNITKSNDIYTIKSQNWDMLGEINRDSDSLRIDFKRFITIYDLNYFDFVLSSNYNY